MISTNEIENIKHIFRQAFFINHLTEAAIEKRDIIFKGSQDLCSKFLDEKNKQFTTHMAVINILYNYLVLPKELIFKELEKIPSEKIKLDDINNELKQISKITYKEKSNGDDDLFRRLRNALAHGHITLREGGFDFHDEKNETDKIDFSIDALDLKPIINKIERTILIPFINNEIKIL